MCIYTHVHTYLNGEFLSPEFEGEVESLGEVRGQRVQTRQLHQMKETCIETTSLDIHI